MHTSAVLVYSVLLHEFINRAVHFYQLLLTCPYTTASLQTLWESFALQALFCPEIKDSMEGTFCDIGILVKFNSWSLFIPPAFFLRHGILWAIVTPSEYAIPMWAPKCVHGLLALDNF